MALWKDDILNRFPTYSGTAVAQGDGFRATLKDAEDEVVEEAFGGTKKIAWRKIRFRLIGGHEILPSLTTTQRDGISNVDRGQQILNETTGTAQVYDGTNWI